MKSEIRPAARQHYEAALRLSPDDALAHENLGTLLVKLGQFDQALAQYQAAARQQPDDAHVPYLTAKAYLRRGEPAEAVKWLHQTLELDPNDPQALALLARLLATDEDSTRRDGPRAVALAEKANALAGQGQPFFLDVLAMTYAEAGRTPAAAQTAAQALDLAAKAGLTNLETNIRKHLEALPSGSSLPGDLHQYVGHGKIKSVKNGKGKCSLPTVGSPAPSVRRRIRKPSPPPLAAPRVPA